MKCSAENEKKTETTFMIRVRTKCNKIPADKSLRTAPGNVCESRLIFFNEKVSLC